MIYYVQYVLFVWKFDLCGYEFEPESVINTFEYHVFAPMGRFQLELFTFIFHRRPIDGTTVENKGE